MHHKISILWTPFSCHYHNKAIWVDQSQTGQARSLQAQSLATLLQGGTRQLLPTDGKIEEANALKINFVESVNITEKEDSENAVKNDESLERYSILVYRFYNITFAIGLTLCPSGI